jgi:amphi-Trp domain-containing protein
MEECKSDVPVSEDATVDSAEQTVESVEAEIEETLTRTKVISRLKAIVLELEGGSLVVGGVPVGELADSVDFELEYSEKDGRREIEIELKW